MNKYLFLFILSFYSVLVFAQKAKDFPESWKGDWAGELTIYNAKGVQMKLPMELHILPTDSANRWTWTLVYKMKDKPKDERKYELVVKDKAKGHYVVDEKDGILLDSYYIAGTLFSSFEVQGTEIISMDKIEGNKLMFEMIVKNAKAVTMSGGTSEEVPPVSSFLINGYHKAVLKRVKK